MRGALAALRSNPLENPANPITAGRMLSAIGSADELWGDGADVTRQPTSIGTALRCVQIISSLVAGCPLRTWDVTSGNPVTIPALVSLRPGVLTPFERVETTVAHLALWGNAYWRMHRARDGRLVELVPIHPSRVTVDVDDGQDAAAVGLPWVKKMTVDGKVPYTERDILHMPGLSVDGVRGISVVTQLRRTFELAANAERVADRMYKNGMLLSGFLTTDADLDEEQAVALKTRWREKLGGVENAHDVAVLDNGTKFEQLSMSPADAQFLESRKFSITELARVFGLPGWLVNDQEKSTSWGTGMEQQFRALVQVTLRSYMSRMEQRITRTILDPKAEKAEFKVEGLLRGDSQGRAAFYNAGITGGWMTPNDVRALEDMKPVDWGDQPYRPYNATKGDPGTEPLSDPAGEDDEGDDQ